MTGRDGGTNRKESEMSGRLLVLSAALLVLMVASCAENTTSPQTPGVPEFVRVTDPFSTSLGLSGSRTATSAPSTETTVMVSAAAGGLVTAGRYSVMIPPGALPADTWITVRAKEADGTVGCELLPHGLVFAVPVTLSMNLTGTSYAGTTPVTIYWYDTSKGLWVDVGGSMNPATTQVSTPLPHFSDYKAGRAGW
jgi:hypothetical protein